MVEFKFKLLFQSLKGLQGGNSNTKSNVICNVISTFLIAQEPKSSVFSAKKKKISIEKTWLNHHEF